MSMPSEGSFGHLLRRCRTAAHLTQAELAERASLSVRGINDLERGARTVPRSETVHLLADALGLEGDNRSAFFAAARGIRYRPAGEQIPAEVPATPAMAPSPPLPNGTVTFLFTDIEGSTQLLQRLGHTYAQALGEHQALLRAAWSAHDGTEIDTAGDGFFVAFASAPEAVAAAADATRALAEHAWPEGTTLQVRMGLHTGTPQLIGDRYVGLDVHRAARIAAAGHGGQVLLSAVTHGLVEHTLPEGATLRDVGTHRLKDLQHAEHLYQLVLPGLPMDFPPLRTLDAHSHNLPTQPTPLLGREEQVAAVCSLLRRDEVRLVTLTGPGGIGKTRLSYQVAAELVDDFPDGVWLVRLSRLTDPALVLPNIAQTLGLRELGGTPLAETLQAHLRAKRLLLVLDNFEQVADAAPAVSELLAACPGVNVLVTSRVALHLRGEHAYALRPLALPDLQHLPSPEQLAQYAAVALFIERAQAARADFQVTTATAPAVAKICARLDGVPLAIELAAARVKVLPPPALLKRLDRALPVLTGGARDLDERQQTMRSTLAWSYDLLSAAEQRLFRRLAVFVGGCTLEAAEMVCVAPEGAEPLGIDVLDGLSRLVGHSLVQQRDEGEAGEAGGEPRFGMLQVVREFALEQLEAGEAEAVRDRHLAWFLAWAEDVSGHVGSVEQEAGGPRLASEYDNLLSALEWSRAQAPGTEGESRLAGAMEGLWIFLGHLSAGRVALEKALARSNPNARTRARARVLVAASQLAAMQSDIAAAGSLAGDGVAIYRELGDKQALAYALNSLIMVALRQGDEESGRSLQAESMALFREAGRSRGLAMSLFVWGDLALERGEYARAREQLEESLALIREVGERRMSPSPLTSLGRLACAEGNYATARALIEEGLTIRRELGETWRTAISLNSLGEVARCEGTYDQAAPLFEEALALNRELSDRSGIGWSLHNLGHVALQAGDTGRAATLFAESLTIRTHHDYKAGVAAGLSGLAGVAAATGQPERAARLFGAAEMLLASIHAALAPADTLVHDRTVAAVRAQLSEAAFTAAFAAGRALALEEAIAEALGEEVGAVEPGR